MNDKPALDTGVEGVMIGEPLSGISEMLCRKVGTISQFRKVGKMGG